MCVLQDHVYNSVFQFQLKKNQSSAKLSVGEVQGAPSPGATKYMKRFLSPSNQERSPYSGKEVVIARLSLILLISALPSL